ncbi:hypothetical protein IQ254_05335 [Nodosilinea sp. LEGE 07088]|uniref:C1 family peptidase n=1 Tax=Nodosilinea sp. LEGE 07088 TaxID=2777968 RepID=UPI00187FC961|nr:C1 family peptidase [Nodosilinea sp. LEGE 07088]MBE9136629.1 hypothetical protein [Nodosilinea sp. LEGE 07088]
MVTSNENFRKKGLGWVADNPDLRDYRLDSQLLDSLEPEKCDLNFKIVNEILKQLKQFSNANLNNLIDYLDFELDKYSVFSIRYFDVLKPQNSHPKVKEFKHHFHCFYHSISQNKLRELKVKLYNDNKISREEKTILEVFHQLTHRDLIQWMRSDYYDNHLIILVKLFQAFVAEYQELRILTQEQEHGYEEDNNYKIAVDGIIGIDTFKALTYWLNFGCKGQDSFRGAQKEYRKAIPVPYPSPVPTEVLSQILISFLPREISDGLKKRFKENFRKVADSIENDRLREDLLKDQNHVMQEENYISFHFYRLADFIAKEHYLLIEPLVLVALQFVGTVGAYENFEYAIKMAASQFKFIVDLDIGNLQKIIENIDFQIKSGYVKEVIENMSFQMKPDLDAKNLQEFTSNEFGIKPENMQKIIDIINFQMKPNHEEHKLGALDLEGLEDLKTIFNLKILGSTEKLPDESRMELIEEIENLRWLQQISYWAIFQFIRRYYQEFLASSLSSDWKKERWDQDLCNDFEFLLKGDNKTGGLFKTTIDLGVRVIKITNPDFELGMKDEELRDKEKFKKKINEFNEFVACMKEFFSTFPNLIEDKPSVIEFIQDQPLADIELGLKGVIEKETQKKFGYKDAHKEPLSIFEFSSNYRIPVGDNLIRNIYWGKTGEQREYFAHLPEAVDLTYWCPPVSDQGSLNACTAHAGVALLEYFARQDSNDPEGLSIQFLYKVTRNLANRLGNVGASPRETMRAMVSLGIPPARFWTVDESAFDNDPPNFTYSLAQNYQTLSYFRIDHADVPKDDLLTRIKIVLAAGFPCMFGFTLYQSMYESFNVRRGFIPYPLNATRNLRRLDTQVGNNAAVGGHAVVAVGYHNYKRVPFSGGKGYSQGAILVRNSWGTDWGIGGYGWLPYEYILKGLTSDWWSLINAEWLKTGNYSKSAGRDRIYKLSRR